jgi:hypothetical protein
MNNESGAGSHDLLPARSTAVIEILGSIALLALIPGMMPPGTPAAVRVVAWMLAVLGLSTTAWRIVQRRKRRRAEQRPAG